MAEQLRDDAPNFAIHPPRIERMPLPASLYDWPERGAHPVDGNGYGSILSTLYADDVGNVLNPYGPQEERGDERSLRHKGPQRTSDIVLLRQVSGQEAIGNPTVRWQAFVVRRSRTGEIAIPGGFQDPEDADGLACGLRELGEETGVVLPFDKHEARRRAQVVFAGPTLSPRARTDRWIETEVSAIVLTDDEARGVVGVPQQGETDAAEWVDLQELASGQIADTPVRSSHVPYFVHVQAELSRAA